MVADRFCLIIIDQIRKEDLLQLLDKQIQKENKPVTVALADNFFEFVIKMAPRKGAIKDARERIGMGVIRDARDRLSQIAKKKDARLVLQEKRLNKTFGGDTQLTKSGRVAVVRKGGKLELRTLKNRQEQDTPYQNRGAAVRLQTVGRPSRQRLERGPDVRNARADAFAAAAGLPQKRSQVAVVNEPYRKINQILEDRRDNTHRVTRQAPAVTRGEMDYQDQLLQYQQNRGVSYKPAYMDLEAPRRSAPTAMSSRMPTRAVESNVRSRLDVMASDGHRVSVTNLHKDVTGEDVKELFGDIGPLKSATLIRPGTAEIVYLRRNDAVRAIEVYNHRQLDGLPMRCNLVHLDDPDMDVDDDYVARAAAAFVRR